MSYYSEHREIQRALQAQNYIEHRDGLAPFQPNCIECGTKFIRGTRRAAITCSPECSRTRTLRRNRLAMQKLLAADPSYSRRRNLRVRNHMTTEEFEEYYDAQEGLCAFCDLQLPPGTAKIAIDHDHETGEFRGIVHKLCNAVIGHAEKDDHFLAYMEGR